ncbi:MAG: hypothetical protein CL908_03275 [Deltaproteobacteria bacterium]|nr:hypothetical protein [Deltaproteobacteria bacterium]
MSGGYQAVLDAQQEGVKAIAEAAPDAATGEEGEAYLARLSAWIIEGMLPPPSAPEPGFSYNRFLMAGANPECRLGQILLDPAARYRIQGIRNGADRIAFGLYTPTPDAGLQLDGYMTLDELESTADGQFSLQIAPETSDTTPPPSERALSMKPTTRILMVREIYRLGSASLAELSVTRSGGAEVTSPDDSSAAPEARLQAAAARIGAMLHQYLRWSEVFAERPNEMTQMSSELDDAVRGDPETRYFSGYFDLGPRDYLEIEIPKVACDYWMIQANSHWLEPIAGAHRNDATANPDSDGAIRIRISASEGDKPNWLDTAGRTRGTILYRTIGASENVIPVARIVRR